MKKEPTMHRRHALHTLGLALLAAASGASWGQTPAFDHGYPAWQALLQRHVRWLPDGAQSRVDYRGLATERAALQQVLAQWSAVTLPQFQAWSQPQQMAFLINAYNGFTLELILTRYPDLKSIKDLGNLLRSPWKRKFFQLLGEERHLDWIEHEQLRPRYAEPRVHAAVNCASIGCPALRPEAFTAAKLDAQLEDGMQRFMADRTRNRYANGRLEVNQIFKWFREDFEQGHRGFARLEDVMAHHADQLADSPAERDRIRARAVPIGFLDYDWSLNAAGR